MRNEGEYIGIPVKLYDGAGGVKFKIVLEIVVREVLNHLVQINLVEKCVIN